MLTIRELKERLAGDFYRPLLAKTYCKAADQLAAETGRIQGVVSGYQRVFARGEETEVCVCTAAGRTEVGGNHTDHQRGKVLAASVNRDAVACAGRNDLGLIRIYSEGYGLVAVDTAALAKVPEEENTTISLVRGIAARITAMGYPVAGFDAYLRSDVPGGSGLSSSACYEVLVGVMMNHLFCSDALTLTQIAQIGQYAENVYFGKPSGLMDQMACALGGIVAIDFADAEHPVCRQVDFDFAQAGHALCIIDTGGCHADLTPDYGAVPEEMRAVAAALGGEVLSEVAEEALYANLPAVRAACGDRAVLRAMHYYGDVRRVEQQVAALEAGDFDRFLALVSESGRSSFCYLQNVATYRNPKEMPVAVALAVAERLLAGRGAVRVHGGGFAGTIQAYVPLEMAAPFTAGMEAALGKGTCHEMAIRPVGGAVLMD